MEANEHDMILLCPPIILGTVVTDQDAVNEEAGISIGVCVKKPSCPNSAVSEEAMLGDGYTDCMIKKEVAARPECKNGHYTSNSTDDASMVAMLTALYPDHVIKDELVLGPESIQRPHISCANGAISTRHEHTDGVTSNIESENDVIQTINTHTMLLQDTEALSEKSLDIQALKGHCCQVCQKLFTRPSGLKRHMQVHGEKDVIIKPYHCLICHKYFTRSSDLKKHMQVHGAKPVCQLCDKEFSRMTELKIHERLHTGEKLYSCDICKKKFPEIRRLKSHQLVHSSKLYSCDICKKEFRDMLTLNLHKNTHTGGKPYTCDVCKKEFNHLSTLNTHKRVHTGEAPYSCEICDVAFPGLRPLKIHNLFSHADTTEKWDL